MGAAQRSSHWFDFHPSGIVAAGFYGAGTQSIDVRKPTDLESYGHATCGVPEVWDSYWMPVYSTSGAMTSKKTNLAYSVDLTRGIDVYRVDLPCTSWDTNAATIMPQVGGWTTGGTLVGVTAAVVVAAWCAGVRRAAEQWRSPEPFADPAGLLPGRLLCPWSQALRASTVVRGSLVETVVPARLGTSFRWLLGSSWISNIGDGIMLAAGPLLVASQTREPLLVAAAWTLQYLATVLFSLPAGVVADRVDRRKLIVAANLARVAVLGVLTSTIVTGQVNIAVVLGSIFVLGIAETFADNTTATLLPMLVARRDLGIANSRVTAGLVTLNQLVGPPVGALLFGLGRSWPFATQLVCIAASIVLVLRIQLPEHGTRTGVRSTIRKDMREGMAWVWHHPAVRTLVLTIVTFNVTFGAAWSVLVLYSLERLEMGEVGFGLLTSAMATGGMLAIFSYGWLERHVSLGNIMRVGLVIETLTHLALAVNTVPWVAMVVMFVFGAHAFVWGTTSITVRHRAVPTRFQGRVQGVYMIGVTGGIVVGSVLGGLIADQWGVAAPFWFAFLGSAIFLVLIWRQLVHIAHTDEEMVAHESPTGAE